MPVVLMDAAAECLNDAGCEQVAGAGRTKQVG